MRTTLTLDEDVAAVIERLRKSRRQPMKTIINEALREGLKGIAAPSRRKARFQTGSVDLGRCLIGNIDDIAEALATAESESYR